MPMMDGHQMLKKIVKDKKLQNLLVVVLTTSYEAADIHRIYKPRCNYFITKPVDFESFVKVISQVTGYWLTVVVMPGET